MVKTVGIVSLSSGILGERFVEHEAKLGIERLTASCELNAKELGSLMARGGNYEIECYGRAQLMMLTHCPRRTKAGDRQTDDHCNACEKDGGWCETSWKDC